MSFFSSTGLLRYGTVTGYYPDDKEVEVTLDYDATSTYSFRPIRTPIPTPLNNSNGIYIGSGISDGTTVVVGQIEGGEWVIVSVFSKNTDSITLDDTTLLIQNANSGLKIELDESKILFGDSEHYSKLTHNANITSYEQSYSFNESMRVISGIVKRDVVPNSKYPNSLRLKGEDLDIDLKTICLDPTISENYSTSKNTARNLPFVEHREVFYEFAHKGNYTNDQTEFKAYQDNSGSTVNDIYDRRESRADSLSLSLTSPNYLIEKIQGTVIDVFGNILDINRNIIQIGKDKTTSLKDADDKGLAFQNIRELERKSIAYHFEVNARKANSSIDVTSKSDYARDRSKFFFDIDKEGQFKINVPASSEKGNIPLLTRYENYSTFKALENSDDPRKLLYNVDDPDNRKDVYLDSFSVGVVNINDKDNVNGKGAPLDRIDSTSDSPIYIKHGTAHHDITAITEVFKNTDYFSYEYLDTPDNPFSQITTEAKLNSIIPKDVNTGKYSLVNKNLYLSGDKSNAGGRSGSINFDGSIDLNIGANTSDRQSLWLDCAGGILGSIGRDKNGISMAMNLDGDLIVKIGGETIPESQDSRFSAANGYNNALRSGTFDIRVVNDSNEVTIVRIDRNGVLVLSPTRMIFECNQDMHFRSGCNMTFESENMFLQNRLVQKGTDASI